MFCNEKYPDAYWRQEFNEAAEKKKGANLTHPLLRHREAPLTRETPSRADWRVLEHGLVSRKFAVFNKDRSRATQNLCVNYFLVVFYLSF